MAVDQDLGVKLPFTLASMNFISDLPLYETEKPYNCQAKDLDGGEITNLVFEKVDNVPVRDVRGHESEFNLREHGFQILKHKSQVEGDPGSIDYMYAYLEETVQLLKDQLQAENVVCYDLRIRRNVPKAEVTGNKENRSTAMFAVQDVHIDQTEDGGYQRIKRHMREDEVQDLDLEGHQALIMNVWRPLRHPVEDAPLAFCNYRSVSSADLLAADRVYETYNGEIYYMKHNTRQEWYWMSEQSPEDVALFTSFISDPGDIAKFCPHVSFPNPRAAEDCKKRESIEVRAIVIRKKSDSI